MIRLVYVSSTDRDLDIGSIENILSSSRKNNATLGITGILLHIDGGFMQVLEGEKLSVENLYSRIEADPRHWDTQVLLTRNEPPLFEGWSMGFKKLNPLDETAGAFTITKAAIEGKLRVGATTELMTLLKTFYKVSTNEDLPGLVGLHGR